MGQNKKFEPGSVPEKISQCLFSELGENMKLEAATYYPSKSFYNCTYWTMISNGPNGLI